LIPESLKKIDSVNHPSTALSTPQVSGEPVWSESIPQTHHTSPPSWHSAAASIALTVLSRRPVVGGGEVPDGGENQAGNNF
ncbi:MAG: hypothetical protein ACRD18_02805, partial [Terriglobia bacterium]